MSYAGGKGADATMWNLIKASVIGTSHRDRSQPCQDWCEGRIAVTSKGPVLVAAIADGAGSATLSDVGAEFACKEFVERVAQSVSSADFDPVSIDRDAMLDWLTKVRCQLENEAKSRSVSTRELACTFLAAVVGQGWAFFAQVGDGAIVRQIDGEIRVVFWPEESEYANMTYFLTEDNFGAHLQFSRQDGPIEVLAILTDGLQRLVLDFATKEAHEPFFAPIFEDIARQDDPDPMTLALREFLGSTRVNDRTDDDKTLLLAARRIQHRDETSHSPSELD